MTFLVPPRDEIKSLLPYVPGKSAEDVAAEYGVFPVIKLASNENALGSAVDIAELIQQEAPNVFRYPDSAHSQLRSEIARHYKVDAAQVILGNGSDEVIQMLALAFFRAGDEVISSASAFSEYQFAAKIAGADYKEVPLKGLSVDLPKIVAAVTPKTRAIFVANPHNPTGTSFSHAELKTALETIPPTCLLILDEAYAEFADDPAFPKFGELLVTYPNLVVLRTFSKVYGLAGIRIGYGIGCEEMIGYLNKVRQPFNINRICLMAAGKAIQNQAFVAKSKALVCGEKDRVSQQLMSHGFDVCPTQANFLCISIQQSAADVAHALMQRGVIVRPLTSFNLPQHIRVTIGSESENDAFLTAFFSLQGA